MPDPGKKYAMKVKCQRLLFARKVAILSETDMLTGLRNRNAYEQRLHDYASLENCEIASVYVDVNGFMKSIIQKDMPREIRCSAM